MVPSPGLLLIAAEPREFRGLLRFCRKVRKLGWPVHWARAAELNDREALLVANGAGAARAAQAAEVASLAARFGTICSLGFCGALDETMKVGDTFVAESVRTCTGEHPAAHPETVRPHYTGVLESIDHVVQTAQEKSRLRARGASVVEMEAAGVAAKAAEFQARFYCIKSVTDLAGESFQLDLNAALRSDGRFDTMRLIAASCRRPLSALPELVRLGRRAQTASRTLGEFVADCRF
jgi:purine-nucleoside phosphorylase